MPASWLPIAIAAALVLVGLWMGIRVARWLRAREAHRSRKTGIRGERTALRLLNKAGYEVLETQVPGQVHVRVDGTRHSFAVRADALVRRRRRTYIAEFKAGRAGRLDNRNTRRQLLEYAHAYEADGVLLVDATEETIRAVEFE